VKVARTVLRGLSLEQSGDGYSTERLLRVSAKVQDIGVDNYANEMGWTPLHVAAWTGNVELTNLLLRYGFKANQGNAEGWTPAHVAAWNGHQPILEKLIEYGIDISKGNNNGWNPLHLAVANYHLDVVKWLVDKKIDPISINEDGWTALHIAASRGGNDDIVQCLLDYGAYPDIKTPDGITPIYLAFGPGHIKALKILLSKPLNDPSVLDVIKSEHSGLWQHYEDIGVLGKDLMGEG
jgi:ankyrin repeat protein